MLISTEGWGSTNSRSQPINRPCWWACSSGTSLQARSNSNLIFIFAFHLQEKMPQSVQLEHNFLQSDYEQISKTALAMLLAQKWVKTTDQCFSALATLRCVDLTSQNSGWGRCQVWKKPHCSKVKPVNSKESWSLFCFLPRKKLEWPPYRSFQLAVVVNKSVKKKFLTDKWRLP